jgi:hypothetical protein
MEDILVVATVFGSGVLIVVASLFYHYRKEQMRSKERLVAIEKGIAPKELFAGEENAKVCCSRRDDEIYGGVKVLIIGLFLCLALYYTAGEKAAVWGLFVGGVGFAKIIVGILMRKASAAAPES